jgi:hypothetical protein
MLGGRHTILGLAILLALMADSEGRSRHQTSTNQTPKTEQSSAPEQRGTPNQPLTVNVVPTREQQEAAEKETIDAKVKAARDERLIDYTGDLVLVGLVQFLVFLLQLIAFIVQAIYLAKSAGEMRNTTAAAERVAQDQIAHSHQIERAYMSAGGVPETRVVIVNVPISSEPFAQTIPHAQGRELTGRFEVHINNHGKTPGELMQIAIGFCDADNIPPEPIYDPQPFHDWIGPGTQSRPMDHRPIPTDRPATAVYGRLYYRDIFGGSHSSGFIQRGSAPLLGPAPYTASD